eukprot:TRINITY_DN16534_c0_g1_i1.p2 TRINITY_DN16534_c0_g1~~TRINITY_DN16534_c0_g1_i1.p2  ORF type:complete len:163 (+),score=25.70 TRINITY_DN16534_c0_g1_i1:566-1054(+)
MEMIAIARHLRVNIVLCHHAVSGSRVLPPFLRQNLTHCLVTRIASRRLLEAIYEEWVSLLPNWKNTKEFVAWHADLTKHGPGSGVMIDVGGKHPQTLDSEIKSWWMEWAPDKNVPAGARTTAAKAKAQHGCAKDASSSSSSDDDAPKRQRRGGASLLTAAVR